MIQSLIQLRQRLVLETLDPLSHDRKCFRMINGVLVERKVGDVIPSLKTNSEGLKKVLDDLLKQYKSLQDEMEKWKVRLTQATLKCPLHVVLTQGSCLMQKKNNVQVVQQ